MGTDALSFRLSFRRIIALSRHVRFWSKVAIATDTYTFTITRCLQ